MEPGRLRHEIRIPESWSVVPPPERPKEARQRQRLQQLEERLEQRRDTLRDITNRRLRVRTELNNAEYGLSRGEPYKPNLTAAEYAHWRAPAERLLQALKDKAHLLAQEYAKVDAEVQALGQLVQRLRPLVQSGAPQAQLSVIEPHTPASPSVTTLPGVGPGPAPLAMTMPRGGRGPYETITEFLARGGSFWHSRQ